MVRKVCYPSMQLQAWRALFDQLHKTKPYHDGTWQRWATERSEAFPYRYDDGTDLLVVDRDLIPDDDFIREKNARPHGVPKVDEPDDPIEDVDDEPEGGTQ